MKEKNKNTTIKTEITPSDLMNINGERTINYRGSYPTKKELIKKDPTDSAVSADSFTMKPLTGLGNQVKYNEKTLLNTPNIPNTFKTNSNNFRNWIYYQILDILSTKYKYIGLPKNITWYDIESCLLENGTGAFLNLKTKEGDSFKFVPYTVLERQWNKYPIKIKINTPNIIDTLKSKEFKQGEFEILSANYFGNSLWNLLTPYIDQLEVAYFVLSKLATTTQTKAFLVDAEIGDNSSDSNTQQIINNFIKDPNQNVMLIRSTNEMQLKSGRDLLVHINSIKDSNIEQAITSYQYWWELIKQRFGILSNATLNKKERTTASDVNAEQGMNQDIAESMLQYRKLGLDKINKTFGLNISIELQQVPKALENDIDRGLNGGGDND